MIGVPKNKITKPGTGKNVNLGLSDYFVGDVLGSTPVFSVSRKYLKIKSARALFEARLKRIYKTR
jgi:hypothetical protein